MPEFAKTDKFTSAVLCHTVLCMLQHTDSMFCTSQTQNKYGNNRMDKVYETFRE